MVVKFRFFSVSIFRFFLTFIQILCQIKVAGLHVCTCSPNHIDCRVLIELLCSLIPLTDQLELLTATFSVCFPCLVTPNSSVLVVVRSLFSCFCQPSDVKIFYEPKTPNRRLGHDKMKRLEAFLHRNLSHASFQYTHLRMF